MTGDYRIPSLPAGTYDVTAQIEGFATVLQRDVVLNVGRTVTLDFSLKLSTAGESIDVIARTPMIENTESHVTTNVTPEQVTNLPLNDRQFANLGALAPGTALISNPDPTRLTNLAVSLIGGSGRNLNILVDGGDNTDDTVGGINEFYPLESIAEFSFLTSRYKAEYGRASGGVMNVVTKSGTNDFHGSFFTLFRNDALNALSKPEKDAGLTDPPPYSREQFGGSFGGPIVKDRAQFFVAVEREQLDIPVIVDTFGAAPEFDGAHNVPTRHNLYTAKLTATLDPKQYLVVRYGQQKTTTYLYATATNAPTAWSSLTNNLHSILASHNYLLGQDKLNELLFQYADFKSETESVSRDPSEFFLYTGVYVGQQIYTPAVTNQKKYELKDHFSWSSTKWTGTHHFKSGVSFIHEPVLNAGISPAGNSFQYQYLGDTRNAPIVTILQLGGEFQSRVPNNQYGIYFQDDWTFNDRLTLNLGGRYDYVTGFDLDQSQDQMYSQMTEIPFDFSWLRAIKENPSGKLANDTNNFAPRIGFAYDWNGDGATVIRGGWGLYYDFPYTNANLLFPQAFGGNFGYSYFFADDNGIRNADGALFRIGDPLPPNQAFVFTDGVVISPDFRIPFSSQSSIGFSHLVRPDAAIDVDFIHASVRDTFVTFRFNGIINKETGERLLRDFNSQASLILNGGFSNYNGLNMTYRQTFNKGLQIQAAYTLSRVTGNTLSGSDQFRLGGNPACPNCALDFQLGPTDDPRMEGPLRTDSLHRLVLAGIFDLPLDFRFSGYFRTYSASPFNAFLPVDPDGDGFRYSITDEHVNARRGEAFSQLDLRIAKIFRIHETIDLQAILEVFNLFNAENPSNFIGNLSSPQFGTPIFFGDQRLVQLGFRIDF